MDEMNGMKILKWSAVGLVIIILLAFASPITLVGAGERGVVVRLGAVQDRILDEGINFVTPFIDSVITINVKTQKVEVKAAAASKDLQSVSAQVALNYNLDIAYVNKLYQNVGTDYADKLIAPAIQEAIKASTAKYTAEELVTKRPQVKDDIQLALSMRLKSSNINLEAVSITDFDFSPSFNAAIEAKVTTEQEALRAKNELEKVKYESEQKIVQAKAQAESIRLQSDAAQNEKYVSLKRVEVLLEFTKKWDGKLPINIYGSTPLPLLDLTK